MRLLTPNHVSLIEACYPPSSITGTGSEFTPKPQETSRLVYYASNRSGKLQKLGAELQRRAHNETAKAARGNVRSRGTLLVTLAIFKELACECRQESSLLTPYLLNVVSLALRIIKGDLEVTARAATVFTSWCSYADSNQIGVDDAVSKDYFQVMSYCCSLCLSENKDGELRNRSRLVGLAVVSAIAESDLLYRASTQFQTQMDLILPALIHNISVADAITLQTEAANLKSNPQLASSSYMSEFRPGPRTERSAPTIHLHVVGEKGPSNSDVIGTSLQIFSSILRRSQAIQVSQCLNATFDCIANASMWSDFPICAGLTHIALDSIQYQYRFVVPSRIVERLLALRDAPDPLPRAALLKMLHSVLSSDTPLVNVSTSDIMTHLISLLLRTCAEESNNEILDPIVACISALAVHIYYTDQMQDLVQELISKLTATQSQGPLGNRNAPEESRVQSLMLLLQALDGLMSSAQKHGFSSGGQANANDDRKPTLQLPHEDANLLFELESSSKRLRQSPIEPEVWQDSLSLVYERDQSIRALYGTQLLRYISTEIAKEKSDFKATPGTSNVPKSAIVSRLSYSLNDSVARFLHAIHASLFTLATSRSLYPSSPARSRNGSSSHITNPTTPADFTDELDESNRAFAADAQRRDGVLPIESHAIHLPASSTMTDNLPSAPADDECNTCLPSDFLRISALLALVHKSFPVRSLFAGVPMLLSWEKSTSEPSPKSSLSTAAKVRAARELLLNIWRQIGTSWGCSDLVGAIDKALTDAGGMMLIPEFSQNEGNTEKDTWIAYWREDGYQELSLDGTNLMYILASNTAVQSATGLDRVSLVKYLGKDWNLEIALKHSTERYSTHEKFTETGPSPLIKLSPQLMHIENLSLSSLARSVRGVGAGDLREALEGRADFSNPRVEKGSISTLEHVSQISSGGRPTTARIRKKSAAAVKMTLDTGDEVRDLLTKIGVGKHADTNLLKASFPHGQR